MELPVDVKLVTKKTPNLLRYPPELSDGYTGDVVVDAPPVREVEAVPFDIEEVVLERHPLKGLELYWQSPNYSHK